MFDPRDILRDVFDAALAAAPPSVCLPQHLHPRPVGAGKAAVAMAAAVEANWQGPLRGFVVTRYGHGAACRHIDVVDAAHPVPDKSGEVAARRILAMVTGLGPDDLVLCLISGGGPSLLSLPAAGLELADKRWISRRSRWRPRT